MLYSIAEDCSSSNVKDPRCTKRVHYSQQLHIGLLAQEPNLWSEREGKLNINSVCILGWRWSSTVLTLLPISLAFPAFLCHATLNFSIASMLIEQMKKLAQTLFITRHPNPTKSHLGANILFPNITLIWMFFDSALDSISEGWQHDSLLNWSL